MQDTVKSRTTSAMSCRLQWRSFAPIESQTFERVVPEAARAGFPDSTAVQTADGRLLVRSAATLHVLGALGGGWRVQTEPVQLHAEPADEVEDLEPSLDIGQPPSRSAAQDIVAMVEKALQELMKVHNTRHLLGVEDIQIKTDARFQIGLPVQGFH